MKLSFIIVNYKSEKYLEKCISSIREKVLSVDYEIIIVNNDPRANLEAKPPSEFKLINNGKNIGFGAACNVGAKQAQGEILCFLNPDTEIISEKIHELIHEFNRDEKIGIIGPRLVNKNSKTQWWCAGKEFTLRRLIKNNLGLIESKKIWESEKKIKADWVSGAAVFVRNDVLRKIGGFDENFFMYFEDEDFCRRARTSGYKVIYYPDFIIYHACGRSRKNIFMQKKQFFKSMIYYIRKWY